MNDQMNLLNYFVWFRAPTYLQPIHVLAHQSWKNHILKLQNHWVIATAAYKEMSNISHHSGTAVLPSTKENSAFVPAKKLFLQQAFWVGFNPNLFIQNVMMLSNIQVTYKPCNTLPNTVPQTTPRCFFTVNTILLTTCLPAVILKDSHYFHCLIQAPSHGAHHTSHVQHTALIAPTNQQ
jgi:hypothetical protein